MFRFGSALFFATIFWAGLWAQDKQFTDDWTKGANSPGCTLALKETGRSGAEGRTIVSYRLFASGLPKGQHFTTVDLEFGKRASGCSRCIYQSRRIGRESLG